ncbi:hypothetical protein [Streptomyces sp. NBC_01618]|uniref:hypothetical protein n=1 Tax=Streptomyces sp. NBC_01618 TaxID=2975900 RepID=UPI003868361A|nr:hypothetical protein OH735_00030 [Streptomyces sp. NBC_01618]WTE38370.1 hypothetical protein OH735_38395 [Streptomyces sp. NBC_01618]
MRLSKRRATTLNRRTRFLHQHRKQRGTLPCLETNGTQVYAYWKRGEGLDVSVHLDTGEVPADVISPDGTIPIRITVNGDCVFSAD